MNYTPSHSPKYKNYKKNPETFFSEDLDAKMSAVSKVELAFGEDELCKRFQCWLHLLFSPEKEDFYFIRENCPK